MEEDNFPHLDTETDTSLEDLDFDRIRQERFDRNRHFLERVNPVVAAKVFSHSGQEQHLSKREEAAVTIQRFWRGFKGRQIYLEALWNKFEQEEEKQQEKVRYQMEEGELLVENHQLEVLLEDGKTVRRNAGRQYIAKVITIQRAWRHYLERKKNEKAVLNYRDTDISNHGDISAENLRVNRSNPFNENGAGDLEFEGLSRNVEGNFKDSVDDVTSSFNPLGEINTTNSDQEVKLSDDCTLKVPNLSPRQSRKNSLLSQAKKFAELKKLDSKVLPFDLHLHLYKVEMSQTMAPSSESSKGSQNFGNKEGIYSASGGDDGKGSNSGKYSEQKVSESVVCDTKSGSKSPRICDNENNSSKECKLDMNITENSFKTCVQTPVESRDSEKGKQANQNDEETNAFDVYNIETALPNMDWQSLEAKLKAASEEAKKIQEARRNDREEIRKKLAMGTEDDGLDDDDDDDITYKKSKLQSRLHSGLQICFMNESPGDTDNEGVSPRQHEIHDNAKLLKKVSNLVDSDNNLSSVTDLNNPSPPTSSIQSTSPPRLKEEKKEKVEDFHTRQEQLQNEAKVALAQAGSMAHMQLEIEKQLKKKSPMAEMVGIPGLGEKYRKKLSIRQLQQMNLASIQVLYNDLQTQIESLNEELVHLLMERDELHMEQDSMLVDIEDLTRRAEELAKHANMTGGNKGNKSSGSAKGKMPAR